MPSIHSKLDHLRKLSAPVRRAALVAALRAATPQESDALVAEIIDPAHHAPDLGILPEVIARWEHLSIEARRAVTATAADRLNHIFQSLAASPNPETRRAPTLLLADALENRVPAPNDLQTEIATALSALTPADFAHTPTAEALASVAANLPNPASDSLEALIDRTLANAAHRYESHRSPALMDTILSRAPHPGPNLAAWLADTAEPGHLALRSAARRLSLDQAARHLVKLLAVPAVAGTAAERLDRLNTPDLQLHLMLEAPLLVTRNRSQSLNRTKRPESILPSHAALRAMPVRARLGYIRWIDALPLRDTRRLELLAVAATDADPRVRLTALRALTALEPTPALDQALAQLGADPDPRVAIAALSTLAAARSPKRRTAIARLITPLAHSPHTSVRRTVTRLTGRARQTNDDGITRWTDPAATRHALLRSRQQTISELRAQINDPDPIAALAAIDIVTRLDLIPLAKDQLLKATRALDPFVAARAARALKPLNDIAVRTELLLLLEHEDARVRADAVESLGASHDIQPINDERFIESPTPRIRANTLHAMLHAPPHHQLARAGLAQMLKDSRSEHRNAALWLSQRAGVIEMADHVAHVVRTDPDPQIRDRARRCGRRLLAEMRREWTHPQHHHPHFDESKL